LGRDAGRSERLLPLIWRWISLSRYRSSRAFRAHRRQVGANHVMSVPEVDDMLAVYLMERLPARRVRRLQEGGVYRRARLMRSGLSVVGAVVRMFVRFRQSMGIMLRSVTGGRRL